MNVKKDLKQIYTSAIDAVSPVRAVNNHLKVDGSMLILNKNSMESESVDLDSFKRIFVVGGGKATASMARAVEELLGSRVTGGCVSVKYGHVDKLDRIDLVEASHPLPDANGVAGAAKIYEILKDAREDDLVISLISGGGSALMPLPPEPISLEDKQNTTNLLLKCGATIHEINAVRKHLSRLKGGNMARAAFPARVINLMISDVVGDNMDVIASGPFVHDRSSFADAASIIRNYNKKNEFPESVSEYLQRGEKGEIPENPLSDDTVFQKVSNMIIASNIQSLEAASEKAAELGYNSVILSSLIEGDTKDAALWHSRIAEEIVKSSNPVKRPACVITGGETTVKVMGEGKGGRNMEFAMHAAKFIDGLKGAVIASVGTDGNDGPTDAAGAVAWDDTMNRARSLSLNVDEYMKNNDSYNLFRELGDLIITGPTNTNVMDIRIILVFE